MKCINDACPISLIPIKEIQHPVFFRKELSAAIIVYSAEDAIEWLKNHSLLIPITNKPISPDFAINILLPYNPNDQKTTDLISKAGFLDGAGGKVYFFICFFSNKFHKKKKCSQLPCNRSQTS